MSIYTYEAENIRGERVSLSQYQGQVLLIVNTASECGYTKQYGKLQELYDRYKDQGFTILGFPCNQFGGQEPGDNEQIASFCSLSFGVTFPMFGKVEVNGSGAHPLFTFLKRSARGILGTTRIKWNFTKFLISRDGKPVKRFAPNREPSRITGHIERLLR